MIKLKEPIKLLIDNKYAINLAKNPIAHGKNKHIETRFHYLRDQVNKSNIKVEYCHTPIFNLRHHRIDKTLAKNLKIYVNYTT